MSLPINIERLLRGNIVEWERLDFKEGWNPEEIVHSMCAFANDLHNWGGGYIIVGVAEKDGVPVLPPKGIDLHSLDSIQKSLVQLTYKVEPYVTVISEPVEYMGRMVLVVYVPGGETRPYKAPMHIGKKEELQGKVYFVRQGSVTRKANEIEEQQLISLAAKVPFDDRICHEATVQNMSKLIIGDFLKELHITEGRSTGFPKIYRAIRQNMSPMPHFETDANNLYFLATVPIHPAFIDERAFLASIGKELDEVIEKTNEVIKKTDEVIRENAQMSQKTDEVSQKNVFLLQQLLLLAQRAHDLSDKMSLEVLESIFSQINKNKSVSMAELAQHSSTSLATIKRYLSHLYEYGFIIHHGPDKGGYRTINWDVIK